MRTKPRLADVSGVVTKLSVSLMNVTSQEQCPRKTPRMGAECKKDRRNQTRKNPARNQVRNATLETQNSEQAIRMRKIFPTFIGGWGASALLLIRLVMGLAFVLHGWPKIQ